MTYRIYKLEGAKCIRKFESIDEATQWCWGHEGRYVIRFQYEDESSERTIVP